MTIRYTFELTSVVDIRIANEFEDRIFDDLKIKCRNAIREWV